MRVAKSPVSTLSTSLEVTQTLLLGGWPQQQGTALAPGAAHLLALLRAAGSRCVYRRWWRCTGKETQAITGHWQMKVKRLAGSFNSSSSNVLSAYSLNKSKTALMRYLTKQNAESFLVHHLFSRRGNLLSSPSQLIKTFETFLLGWQWLEKTRLHKINF